MAAKLMITDWRGPGSWTAPQRARTAQLVSCSVAWGNPGWQQKPIAGVTTLVGVQMGLELYDGLVPGSAGEPKYDIAAQARALGYDLFPLVNGAGVVEMAPIRTYAANPANHAGTETYSLNVSRAIVGRWWAQKMVDQFPWADGLHVDYWTPPSGWVPGAVGGGLYLNAGYTGVSGGSTWDTAFMVGMNRAIHEYRRLRTLQGKSTLVIGQQFHNMNGGSDIRELDSRYNEQDPDQFVNHLYGAGGYSSWAPYHQSRFDAWAGITGAHAGAKSNMVMEMSVRAAGPYLNKPYPSSTYQADVMTFANTNNCFVSWGREDQAGIGWPG